MPNAVMAEKVLRSILAHPEEHDQNDWIKVDETEKAAPPLTSGKTYSVTLDQMEKGGCGTSACVAGWTALHLGWSFEIEATPSPGMLPKKTFRMFTPEGQLYSELEHLSFFVRDVARDALGLTPEQTSILFFQVSDEEAIGILYCIMHGIEGWEDMDTEDLLYALGENDPLALTDSLHDRLRRVVEIEMDLTPIGY